MQRWCTLLLGAMSYLFFLGVFLYAIGFLGNFLVPRALDGPAAVSWPIALSINLLLVGLFALQHSLMARPWFKRWWLRFVSRAAERSIYVLCTNLVLAVLFWQWQPMGGVIWRIESGWGRGLLYGLFACGWVIVLASIFLINHFDLFGLRQVWTNFQGRPYVALGFVTPGLYRYVRHPLYVGWLLAFWATPTMTVTHLTFAVGMTAYLLIAIRYEERDLVAFHGKAYEAYRQRVPMLIPRPQSGSAQSGSAAKAGELARVSGSCYQEKGSSYGIAQTRP